MVRTGDLEWDLAEVIKQIGEPGHMFAGVDQAVSQLLPSLRAGDHVVVMSNGGFGDIHNKILRGLGT